MATLHWPFVDHQMTAYMLNPFYYEAWRSSFVPKLCSPRFVSCYLRFSLRQKQFEIQTNSISPLHRPSFITLLSFWILSFSQPSIDRMDGMTDQEKMLIYFGFFTYDREDDEISNQAIANYITITLSFRFTKPRTYKVVPERDEKPTNCNMKVLKIVHQLFCFVLMTKGLDICADFMSSLWRTEVENRLRSDITYVVVLICGELKVFLSESKVSVDNLFLEANSWLTSLFTLIESNEAIIVLRQFFSIGA